MDIDKLTTFIYAADNKSFSKTAKQLHLTQPTISHQIKTLENELNIQLFERTGSSLELTEAGRLILPWARKVVRQSHEMLDMLSLFQKGNAGNLRIACSTTAGKYILPQLAARFCQLHPGIKVNILRCTPQDTALSLLEGEANLGVVSSEIRDDIFESQEFITDTISLIVPADHPWAFREAIEPEELIGEPIIIREPTSGTRQVMLSELAKSDISLDDLNIFMELGNAEAIVRTIAAGYAVSFVSTLALVCCRNFGTIVAVPIAGFDLRRKTYMIRKKLQPPHHPQEVFWSFIHNPANVDLLKMTEA
jgi:DNA-binding transcriptional LysR family regulator